MVDGPSAKLVSRSLIQSSSARSKKAASTGHDRQQPDRKSTISGKLDGGEAFRTTAPADANVSTG
jgi:hypothetical protein